MRALELVGFDGPASLRIADRPEPLPGPGQVRVRLRASALNHLDVFVTRGLPKRPLPAILGADGAGVIDAVGPAVQRRRSGDEVVIYPVVSCGACEWCARREEVHCEKFGILGEHLDGTFQESLVVAERAAFTRPQQLDWHGAAALPLSFLTAWRLLFTRGRLESGDTLVIVGIGGGVALAALLLGKAHGLRVFATSRDPAKLERAKALGADGAYPSDGFAKSVRDATGGAGARAVVDTIGPSTFDESFRALAREGVLLTVGSTSGPKVELTLPRLFFRHLSLVTSTMGTSREFEAMLADVDRYHIRPVVDATYPLVKGPDAFARLEGGEQFGKIVLDIAS
ncbi:MAG: zinc-binding dehydrogenase [Chloroflexi bacterium]|nr:MAG: zinc-binding dehydrogenase [Chloroflexota bacterium]